jgi:hypothetical protein
VDALDDGGAVDSMSRTTLEGVVCSCVWCGGDCDRRKSDADAELTSLNRRKPPPNECAAVKAAISTSLVLRLVDGCIIMCVPKTEPGVAAELLRRPTSRARLPLLGMDCNIGAATPDTFAEVVDDPNIGELDSCPGDADGMLNVDWGPSTTGTRSVLYLAEPNPDDPGKASDGSPLVLVV